ncbi:acyl-CoA dehydrogenase/oxidase [Fomitopsis serialis]|uniref:acyl-CoA dehydrogenase/oxidase n=1 Tax=Fomitopsis serialis TaxID=139415 RepID=UPI002007663F|nr:acyl-CoA dehydrogenase/oxidase [Neoantrodia serialis]KAH9934315.1 acyl-CoA dehydrogenase/oxidase [Neoantrodia serialis]
MHIDQSQKRAHTSTELTLDDVDLCTSAFIRMHRHPIMALDVGCANILACHVNLFLGTIAPLIPRRPDLKPLVERALKGEVMGNFLLTEVGHGLDILGLETVAEKVEDGFILHTPNSSACKFMPPTMPHPVIPKVAIVFARLMVGKDDRGIHPFLLPTSYPGRMHSRVSAVLLPPRNGTCALDYALTSFDQVKLPPSAFLGADYLSVTDHHALLKQYIRRITLGQICIPMVAVTGIKLTACIGVDYSYRRHVQGTRGDKFPIMSFRTQQLPVLYSVAVAHVLDAWSNNVAQALESRVVEGDVLQGMATIFKTTVCRFTVQSYREVAERLGAQGTFGHNFVSRIEMDMRGLVIAEGDVTTIAIRLFSELLQRKYTLPQCTHEGTLLEKHARGVYNRCAQLLGGLPDGHRDPLFNALVLPQCERGVLALGCSYAYSCALDAGVPRVLLDLFECAAIRMDPAWYTEVEGIGEMERIMREHRAVTAMLPHVQELADGLKIRHVIPVPILSDAAWDAWVESLVHKKEALSHFFGPSPARL